MSDRFIRVSEAARRLGYSRTSIYRMIREGLIPVVRVGNGTALRIRESDLDQFIAERPNVEVSA